MTRDNNYTNNEQYKKDVLGFIRIDTTEAMFAEILDMLTKLTIKIDKLYKMRGPEIE